ncbi:PAS domain-containing sensor histidine kinase [Methanoregula sp.]|uniref:PAS domain-containing sensor histidine kinase n=1 Tax=Methanoregula sp. TaxID=2052170 RepID=UPI003BB0BE90
MIGGYQVDVSVAVNLLMSVAIVVLSVWGYYKIKKSTPLYFGFAYTLFAISHFLLLTGGNNPPGAVFFVLRTGGYALVATGLFALLKDIILRQEVECDLRESRKRLAATFDQAAVGIAGILPGGHIAQVNRRFCDILGYTVTGILNVLPHTLIAPDDQRDTFEAIKRIMKGDLPGYTSEIQCIRKDGSSIWCELFISPVRGTADVPCYCILVLEDISARKTAEAELARLTGRLEERVLERTAELAQANEALIAEVCQRTIAEERLRLSLHEKEILINEIHHRVKNNLQIIVSLLYLQSQKTSDSACGAALLDSQTRIKSMALIHENLYQSGDLALIDFDRYLRNLAGNLMVAYGVDRSGIRATIHAQDLTVNVTTAVPLGLIANELISNALKYGFTGRDGGEITLTGQKEKSWITLVVKDNGRGIPEEFDWEHADSLGFNLVLMLVRQLKGTITLGRTNGTQFVITIPYAG